MHHSSRAAHNPLLRRIRLSRDVPDKDGLGGYYAGEPACAPSAIVVLALVDAGEELPLEDEPVALDADRAQPTELAQVEGYRLAGEAQHVAQRLVRHSRDGAQPVGAGDVVRQGEQLTGQALRRVAER